MNTKLTAKRYNTRSAAAAPVSDQKPENLFEPQDDGLGPGTIPPEKASPPVTEEELAAVQAEGLTGRQLRLARRIAAKHNITGPSDEALVVLLRRAGVDPLQRSSMMDLVVSGKGDTSVQLPQKIEPMKVPSTEHRAEESHLRDLREIQKDIAKRRRRKVTYLFARLAFFVALPTVIAGYYFHSVATPLYSTESQFVIQQAQNPTESGGLGGMLATPSLSTVQDSVAVQGYLQSREAMERLDADEGFREAFSGDHMDVLQRLPANPTLEDVYSTYEDNVKISYDPTEGIVKMEVTAPEPGDVVRFSQALIGYAEQQVDQLTQRMREDQMAGARQGYEDAEAKVTLAQENLVNLQERFRIISSDVEVTLVTQQLSQLDTQLLQERLSLAQLSANAAPNEARMQPIRARIERLESEVTDLRARLTETTAGGDSLARLQAQLAVAQADVETRQTIMADSLRAMETARVEATRQTRYLSRSVNPVLPDEPAYPRAFENTLVSFLVFLGIYLMISMTVAILREQVSS
ncbi:capsule biosynthesis protein [Falsirhodobacter halotolerans]|uniref:capsule biosynthesis protein n=1 Tax=Falsirhodobacter halotolerans TaxID=1146892 RepID=UPI001FCFA3B6|nr:capsule biosynthesis protein [Falsirhodobacter halotolerans]MCJ8139413.1 capsule biosynthesis protein [Falsirhodobacter halotolerans]